MYTDKYTLSLSVVTMGAISVACTSSNVLLSEVNTNLYSDYLISIWQMYQSLNMLLITGSLETLFIDIWPVTYIFSQIALSHYLFVLMCLLHQNNYTSTTSI